MGLEITPAAWQQVSLVALALIMLCAILVDVRQRRIPNALVLATLFLGILCNTLGPEGPSNGGGLFTRQPGALGLGGALLGTMVGLLAFMPLHLLHVMGAGDVKLMAGIGGFVGAAGALNLALFILAAGGLLAIVYMLWTRSVRQVMFNVSMALSQMLPGSTRKFDSSQTVYRMPYTLAMACGMLVYGSWLLSGGKSLIKF